MPSFCVSSNCNHWLSWGVLVFGFFGMASAYPTNFIWLGNPLLFSSWLKILLRERPPAVACSCAAFGLGSVFLVVTKDLVSESGTPDLITGYGAGYWLCGLAV